MECERFKRLLKNWYIQVQDESLAPARMVTFMKQHIAECPICLMDPSVRPEVEKIAQIILPPSKVRTPPASIKAEGPIPAKATAKVSKTDDEAGEEEQDEEVVEENGSQDDEDEDADDDEPEEDEDF
jgi:nucleosome binding factor SPN SPT16 subunit